MERSPRPRRVATAVPQVICTGLDRLDQYRRRARGASSRQGSITTSGVRTGSTSGVRTGSTSGVRTTTLVDSRQSSLSRCLMRSKQAFATRSVRRQPGRWRRLVRGNAKRKDIGRAIRRLVRRESSFALPMSRIVLRWFSLASGTPLAQTFLQETRAAG